MIRQFINMEIRVQTTLQIPSLVCVGVFIVIRVGRSLQYCFQKILCYWKKLEGPTRLDIKVRGYM